MRENMSHKQKTLWTKDFTSIAIATILTAVGGEAMNLPISLLVFDETGSTFLSALVLICGVLPDIVLSVLVAPLIDKGGKKKWIVGLDIVTAGHNVFLPVFLFYTEKCRQVPARSFPHFLKIQAL